MNTIIADEKLISSIREVVAEELKYGQSLRTNTKGSSMYPFIKKDDMVIVKPIKFEQTRIGDIIVYKRAAEGDFTMHRLIRKRKDKQGRDFLFTKADASIHGDFPVYSPDVYGKVVIIEQKNGRTINLETRFNRLFAYYLAYLSWTSAYLKEAIFFPSQFLRRVRKYFFRQKEKIENEYLTYAAGMASNNGRHKCRPYDKIKKDFDWDYLLNRARKNGVSPLLYFYQKEEKESFPKKFFEELEKDYYQTLTRNILIWEEIKSILKSLEEKKIEVMLLKGIALGVTIYPSLGLRPMADVDILIKDKDIFKVNETLNRLGYFSGINLQDIELGKTEYLTTLCYPGKNLSLHLHWHLVNSTIPNFSYISKINMERIWQKARLIEIFGIKALILSPEYLIIYLCEHSLRVTHSLSRLIFLTDISQAINYYQDKIDWDFLVKESYHFGLERMVYCGLYSANRILRTEVPSDILSFLKPKRLTLGEKIFLSLVAKIRSSPGLSYLVHLAMNKKLLEKIKFLFRTLFPPKKVLAQGNCIPPSKINYFHYLSRLKRVLRHALISISH